MLNKELMMTSCGPEAHVLMTVEEVFDPVGDMDRYHAGWIEGECGSVNRIPYWKTGGENRILKGISCYWDFDLEPYETQVQKERERDYMGSAIEIEINGVKVSCNLEGTTQTVHIDEDPFNLKGSIGKTININFTPPQTVTFRKYIKQLFKILEGCLDVKQRASFNKLFAKRSIGRISKLYDLLSSNFNWWSFREFFNWSRFYGIFSCSNRNFVRIQLPRLGRRISHSRIYGLFKQHQTVFSYVWACCYRICRKFLCGIFRNLGLNHSAPLNGGAYA